MSTLGLGRPAPNTETMPRPWLEPNMPLVMTPQRSLALSTSSTSLVWNETTPPIAPEP
jgi:hypothetical protein